MKQDRRPSRLWQLAVVGLMLMLFVSILFVVILGRLRSLDTSPADPVTSTMANKGSGNERHLRFPKEKLTLWATDVPPDVQITSLQTGQASNIAPRDYAGPESCRKCHVSQYTNWSQHSHRFMNTRAEPATVKGDFSGKEGIKYLGGTGSFVRVDDAYFMRLERGPIQREYSITQTIGSRFFQYYVGVLKSGPEPPDHEYYKTDHVLPFGYWLEQKQWVPVVHVNRRDELPDGQRDDPYDLPLEPVQADGYYPYATACNHCHTTFALGDQLIRFPYTMDRHAHRKLHFSVLGYIRDARPDLLAERANGKELEIDQLLNQMERFDAREHAVTLGVSCEACHLGAKAHAEQKQKLPAFFPKSPHLFSTGHDLAGARLGRTQENVNWACGRCHAGDRPEFAGGMATWNSVEFSDAARGSCYSQLRCVDCHNPHKTTGKQWALTPAQDDQLCVKCHQQFTDRERLQSHTHHAPDSEGSHCMNCHMPRLNEGLQDVVRTHTIFSPTRADMIEANHPNACNLCHTQQPLKWTLEHLKSWYKKSYSLKTEARRDQEKPAAISWLQSPDEHVRLVAADALTRSNSDWALPELLNALDDPYLLNRQFAGKGIEAMLQIRLLDYGYRFYMSPEERKEPLQRLRDELLDREAR